MKDFIQERVRKMLQSLPSPKLPDEDRRKFIAWLYKVPEEREAVVSYPVYRRPAFAAAAVSMLFVCVLSYNYLFSPLAPVVSGAAGTVKVYSAAKNEWRFVEPGARIKLARNDILKTFADGQADLVIPKLYHIRMKNDAEIKLARSVSRAVPGDIQYELAKGRAYTYYDRQRKAGRQLNIMTSEAMVSVIGTDFMVDVAPAKTWVGVLDGVVRVTGLATPAIAPGQRSSVLVQPGEKTYVPSGGVPHEPERLMENELFQLEELYRIGTKPQVALLISTGKTRVRELLSFTMLYVSSEKEGALPAELIRAAKSFRTAIKERSKERYLENIRQFEEIVERYPNPKYDVQLLLFIGSYYKYIGDYGKAIETFRLITDRYPRSGLASIAQCAAGVIYEERLHDCVRAQEAYRTVLSKYPSSPEVEEAAAGLKRASAACVSGKYAKNYARGTYKTFVSVVEGRVIVADYDAVRGPDYGRGIDLQAGQKTEATGRIE